MRPRHRQPVRVRGREHGDQVAGQHRRQLVAGEAGVIWIQHGKSGKRETDRRSVSRFVSALGIGDRRPFAVSL